MTETLNSGANGLQRDLYRSGGFLSPSGGLYMKCRFKAFNHWLNFSAPEAASIFDDVYEQVLIPTRNIPTTVTNRQHVTAAGSSQKLLPNKYRRSQAGFGVCTLLCRPPKCTKN